MFYRAGFFRCAGLLAVAACGAREPMPSARADSVMPPPAMTRAATELTLADTGRTITLRVGQEVLVRLPGNHSTGFSWMRVDSAESLLSLAGPNKYVRESAGQPRSGVGGEEQWRFRANQGGKATLRFEYRRPWEKDVSPAETAQFEVRIL